MIAQNLLAAEETRDFRELGIQDRLQSQRNRAYGQVAIAPTVPLDPLEPAQLSGPSTAGRNLGILNAGIGMASGIAGAYAPSVGGGGTAAVPRTRYGESQVAYAPNGAEMYGIDSLFKLWKSQKFNTNLVRSRLM